MVNGNLILTFRKSFLAENVAFRDIFVFVLD